MTLSLADRSARLGAVLIDIVFLGLVVLAVWLLILGVAAATDGLGSLGNMVVLLSVGIILSFLVRAFYFSWFEIRWQGRTPGKRMLGIRVADRNGGRLTPAAVIARNAMRELELFLPLTLLSAIPESPVEGIAVLLTWCWIGIFLLLPLFNRDRLRAGDMVAGTWVINAPRQTLLKDVSLATAKPDPVLPGGRRRETAPDITFTPAQLEIYGIYELQTLERVLRSAGRNSERTKQDVARRIAAKIGYEGTAPQNRTQEFLEAFYTAQRAKLESGLLMGQRKERKDVV